MRKYINVQGLGLVGNQGVYIYTYIYIYIYEPVTFWVNAPVRFVLTIMKTQATFV